MKRFQFRLARLAKVRELQEEIARAEWRAAEDLARRAEQRVHEILQLVSETNSALRELQASEQLSSTEVLALQDLLERVIRTLTGARRQAAELRAAAEIAREPWTALRIELEGLARLEQRAHVAHRNDLTRVENAELDQVALERAARRA